MSESEWTTHVTALLVDKEGDVLVLEGPDRNRLPRVEIQGTDDELAALRDALASLLGIDTIVVRSVHRSVDEERKRLELALELEPRGDSAPATGAAWMERGELASTMSDDERSLLEHVREHTPPPQRAPWARRGWFREACAWMERMLEDLGRTVVAPIEQRSSWCISSILSAETDDGRVFFKATARSPLFVDEGAVTRSLAALFPGQIPTPIAIDAGRRWMLVDDFGPLVGWGADLETKREVLSTYAQIQVEAATRSEELLTLGLFDRRPAWLAAEIESLVRSPAALGLTNAELEELGKLAPRFVDACERLAAGPVPDSLVHGDLHLANVAGERGRYVFFDWTDACVTHPFLDLLVVLFEEDPELQRTLRDAYLDVWAEVAAKEELLELWRFAAPLACLNQAVSYRSILANIEPGTAPELQPMTGEWLRRALAAAA